MTYSRREVLELGAMSVMAASRLSGWARVEPDIEIELTAQPREAQVLPGKATAVWQFTGRVLKGPATTLSVIPGSYLGPTIRLRRGQQVRIRFVNLLPEPSIVHWHGLDVPESADGHPRFAVGPGRQYTYEFEVTNRAGTYWYHPHPHMRTGPQVFSGLAGVLIVSDDEEAALRLPSGAAELLAVIQDRRFDAANQFVYSASMMEMETGFLGNRVLVNGRPSPIWSLATRAYRLRLLNGSNARTYKLGWSDGSPMTILGTDGGLLEHPHVQRFLTLAPAQRAEVWLDLSARPLNTRLELQSVAFPVADAGLELGGMMGARMGGMGAGPGGAVVGASLPLGAPISLLTIEVARREQSDASLPDRLSTFDRSWQTAAGSPVRRIPITFRVMEWFLAGRAFEMDGVAEDETVTAGSTHVWEFINTGGPMGMRMAHPIHLHGRQFRVIGRSGGSPGNALREGLLDAGWTDTVLVLPDETVRLQVPFTVHAGWFLYHCHILEHEDMGMMRNFKVVARQAPGANS